METTLISDQVGTHPSISLEWPCTHIWSCENTSHSNIRTTLCPRLSFPSTSPGSSIQRMKTTLISDQVRTHPSITSEWPCTHIWSCKTTYYNHIRKALSPRPSIPSNWPGTSIPRMAFSAYIWWCRNQSYSHIIMARQSYLTWKEPILSPWQNGSTLTYNHGRNQSSHHVRMAMGLISFPWRKYRSGERQASPWSTQTSP